MARAKSGDEQTLALIQEVRARKAEIAKIKGKPQYVTNCSFVYDAQRPNEAVNLHVQSSIQALIRIAAFLQAQCEGYDAMALELGVESSQPFTWGGFTTEEWKADIKTRIDKIQVQAKEARLHALEARLNLIVSPELRAKMELEAIAAELG